MKGETALQEKTQDQQRLYNSTQQHTTHTQDTHRQTANRQTDIEMAHEHTYIISLRHT